MSKPPPSGGIKLPAPPPKGGAPPAAPAKKPPPGTPPPAAAAAAAAASTPPGTPPVAKKGPPPAIPPPIPQKKGPPPALPKKEPALPPKLPSKVSEAKVSDPSLSMPLPEPPMNIPLPTPPVKAHEIPLPTPPALDDSHEEDSDVSEVSESEPVVETLAEKRFKIVNEILTTEKTYVAALDFMVNSYLHPLLLLAETELLPTRSKAEIRCIFSNVEQLLPINRHLYQSVEDRIKNWSETQLIGDIFLKMAPFFKMYNLYSNNYDAASNMLDKCKQDENFVQAVDKIASTIDHVGLESMLIMPIQRVPRYNLLLSDLLRKTNEHHPDFSILKQALETMENVMQYLDNNITEAENIKKFLAMSKMRGGNRLIQAHRVLITEGVLHIKSKKQSDNTTGTIKKRLGSFKIKEAQLQIWLFNDVLVHLKTTKSKRKTDVASTEYTWPLELIWLKDIKDQDPHDPKMPFSFVLVGPRKTYSLRFPSMDEKLKWMNTIKSAVSKVLNEENAPDDLHRYGHYKFPKDGGEYEGWWKFGRIHGEGVFKFFGNKYTGEWEYNSKCGTGTFECVTGEVYHGEWKEDRPNGYGQLHYTNKDYYDGEWRVGVRAGKGVLLYANGDKYDGEWRENVPCGEGTYTTVTGFIYTGGWLQGKPNGFGCLIAPNGRRFEGQFKEGMKTGEGKMDYANGDFYIGQWKEDKPQGFGIYHSAVEGLYEGMFHNGLKEGQGKMLFKNGDIFEGQWKRNLFHGNGVLVSSSGALEKYDGQWENGKLSGKGVLFYRSGARYEGQFKDDRLHGNGIYISANAVVFDGKWVDGRREGKAVIAVGPSKFTSSVVGGIMAEGEKSFLVVPDVPAIHLEL